MIIPVLSTHKSRNSKTQKTDYRCRRSLSLTFQQLVSQREEAGRAKSYPDTEEIERTRIGIISLPHLIWRLVEIQHNGNTCHEEHQEIKPCSPLIPVILEEKSQ